MSLNTDGDGKDQEDDLDEESAEALVVPKLMVLDACLTISEGCKAYMCA